MNKLAEKKTTMDVVFCIDENYAMPCGIALYSLLHTNKDMHINAHIVGQGLSEKSKNALVRTAENHDCMLSFYTYNEYMGGGLPIPKNSHFTEAAYIRLFIAQLLPPTVHKVLYLDSDVLVFDSLKELWETDISDVPVAAVPANNLHDIRQFNRLGYDISYGYYNSGVLLLNLDIWRNGEIAKDCVSFLLTNFEKCLFIDQDAINYCLRGKIKALSFRYNCLMRFFVEDINAYTIDAAFHDKIREAVKYPAIVHFVDVFKPWHTNNYPALKPLQRIWLFFKAQTPWKKVRLKKARTNFANAMRLKIIKIAVVFRQSTNAYCVRPSTALIEHCSAILTRLKAL